MNLYTFEAQDDQGEPVSNKTEHQFRTVISEETLIEQCRSMARSAMHEFPRDDPWRGWSVQMGVRLDYQKDWTMRSIPFADLLS